MPVSCARTSRPEIVVIIIIMVLVPMGAGAGNSTGAATWRVQVDGVTFGPEGAGRLNLFVTVLDPDDLPVQGLDRSDFIIMEDGRLHSGPIRLAPLAASGRGLAYVVLVDQAEDLATSLTFVRQAAAGFIKEMGFRHEAAVIGYSGAVELAAGPSADAGRLSRAVLDLPPQPEKPRLYDGLLKGVDVLRGMRNAQTRPKPAIILLTEGRDESSQFSFEAALSRLLEAEVRLFLVGYGQDESDLAGLMELARLSGGQGYFTPDPEALKSILLNVAERLKHQLILSYDSIRIRTDGATHRIRVHIRARAGQGETEIEFVSPDIEKPGRGWFEIFTAALAAALVLIWLRARPGWRRPG
ncbi:MAG: VWA domain-containing protein [Thermodesulfobacteriota bacterium]